MPLNHWRKGKPYKVFTNKQSGIESLLILAIANESGYHLLKERTNLLKNCKESFNLPRGVTNAKITELETSLETWLPKLQTNADTTTLARAPSKEFKKAHHTPPFLTNTPPTQSEESI